MSRPLTTSGSSRQGIVWSTGLTLSLLKNFLPHDFLMDVISMAIDIIDPFGFNVILTRSFFDAESRMIYDAFSGYANISLDQCVKTIKKDYPGLEEKTYTDICKQFTDVWIQNTPDMSTVNRSCYSNYNPPSVVSRSGQPGEGCDPRYINFYNKYSSDNKDVYIKDNVITSDRISNVIGFKVPNSTGESNIEDLSGKINPIRITANRIIGLSILLLILFILFLVYK